MFCLHMLWKDLIQLILLLIYTELFLGGGKAGDFHKRIGAYHFAVVYSFIVSLTKMRGTMELISRLSC